METLTIDLKKKKTFEIGQQGDHNALCIHFINMKNVGTNKKYIYYTIDGIENCVPLTNDRFIVGYPLTAHSGIASAQLISKLNDNSIIKLSNVFAMHIKESKGYKDSGKYPVDPNIQSSYDLLDDLINETKDMINNYNYATLMEKLTQASSEATTSATTAKKYADELKNSTDFINTLDEKVAAQDGKIENFEAYTSHITTKQNTKIATLQTRMSEFTSLKDGSTTGDAELFDARIGADGTKYQSAGDAMRCQVEQLNTNLDNTQETYLVEYETLLDNYIKEDTSIAGYIGWDVLSIQVVPNDKVIVYSPSDSKYNAIYSSDNVKRESIVLKKGMNLIEIPEEYRFLRVSNEREIAKKVKFYVLKTQEINGNTKKIKLADNGTFIFDTIPLTYIYDIDGSERYSPTFYSSDYIDVSNHEKIVIESTESSKYNAWYDANRKFIQNLEYKVGFTEFEVPTNAKFIRVSCSQEEFKNIKVIFDTSIYYSKFTYYGAFLPRSARWWLSDRESIIDDAYNELLSAYKINPDIIPLFVCTDSHRWSPQHPQRYVNNIDVDGMEIANINLGDDVVQYWADGKFDMIYNNIRYVKNYIGVCGNHDKIDGTNTTEYFLRRIFTSKKARYIAKSKRCCYTVNDNLHNVKYIIFDPYYAPNSGVPMVSIPTVVATWLVKELSKNDGYDIIFLNHQPLTDNNIHRDGTKQTWKMESYELPIFTALFNLLKARKNKLKGTYTDTDGINHNYDFSQCENELLCLLHGHSHEELYYIEDGLLSYCCDWDGAESNGYKSTFIAIDRNAETFTAWIAKGNEQVLNALTLKITK